MQPYRLLIFAATIATNLLIFTTAHSATPFCGKILSLRGQVEILRIKSESKKEQELVRNAVKAKKRMKLECTDIVLTQKSSRAKIRLSNGALMAMGPFSRIEISKYVQKTNDATDPNLLQLTYGKVRTFIKKKDSKGKPSAKVNFKIKTPVAVVGVRGTDFYVSYEPNTKITGQATIEGKVEVEQIQTGQKATVGKGQQVTVEAVEIPKAPPAPAPGQPAPFVKPLPIVSKPLVVVDMVPEVKEEIRQTSVIAKNEEEFTHKEAVEVLGPPEKWHPPADELPMDLKDLKEEF